MPWRGGPQVGEGQAVRTLRFTPLGLAFCFVPFSNTHTGPRQRQMSCSRRQRRPRLRHAVDAMTCM